MIDDHSKYVKQNRISVAIPISIVRNKKTLFHKSMIISNSRRFHIARTCAIYKVNNIFLYDDQPKLSRQSNKSRLNDHNGFMSNKKDLDLIKVILDYMNCPQYLRKYLFGQCDNLRFAGILEPLGIPSHPLKTDLCQYRQGILRSINQKTSDSSNDEMEYVNIFDVGLDYDCVISSKNKLTQDAQKKIFNIEMTFKDKNKTSYLMTNNNVNKENRNKSVNKHYCGKLVQKASDISPYWGFEVHQYPTLFDIFISNNHEPFTSIIGTSHLGNYIEPRELESKINCSNSLFVFGGIEGLEYLFYNDDLLQKTLAPCDFFDVYLNVCPNQGTRTIRTEEALLAALSLYNSIFT